VSQPLPWRLADVRAAVVLMGLGALAATAGWWGVSRTAAVGEQVPWTGVAVLGLVVGELGAVWVVLSGRMALRRRHGALAARVVVMTSDRIALRTAPGTVVAGERMTRYHRPGCAATAGKAVAAQSVDAHRRAGRSPCDLCRP
jgi:hypothetical protein